MRIAPLRITDPWFHRLARDGKADVRTLSAVPCDIAVHMEAVTILHHGIDQNYRPYLHLRGQIIQIRPDVELPFGVTEIQYRAGTEPGIDAYYEFDLAQLTELVRKGYFGTSFRVPESMTGIEWELPAEADFLVVAPENAEQPPLVFAGVRDQNSAVLTEENSGYTLAEYFPDYSAENPVRASAGPEPTVPTHSGVIQDLFADEYLDDAEHRRPTGPADRYAAVNQAGQASESVFDRLMNELEAQRRGAESTTETDVGYDPDGPAGALRERIGPGVRQALSSRTEAAPADAPERGAEHARDQADESGFLDWGEAEDTSEVGVAPVRTSFDRRSPGERQDEADDYQPGG
ncbi:AAA family ATPase [Nocardiopsis sp. NPDC049922]|uniref:AAA family ATPase n=1 Tax=Nocardiopsis sp. NPDC049922 TaxID=3155157 RepID=UPI00340579C4